MRRSAAILISAGAGLALVAAGTAAGAAIAGPVGGNGVIYGCYTTKATSTGSHTLTLQDVGTTCARGTTAIQWNQTGPAGQAGPAGAIGPAGPAGAIGPAGPAGAIGPAGPAGPQGPKGDNGTAGPAGTNGNTLLNGTGAPAISLGNPGDFYLDTAADVLYGPKDPTTGWPPNGISLVGSPGSQGSAGKDGNSFLSSSGAPTGNCNTGDTDLDRATGEYYTCTASAWTDTGQNIQPAPVTLTWTISCTASPCSGNSTQSIPAGAVLTPESGVLTQAGTCTFYPEISGTISDNAGTTLATIDPTSGGLDPSKADVITAANAGTLQYQFGAAAGDCHASSVTFTFEVTGANLTPPFS